MIASTIALLAATPGWAQDTTVSIHSGPPTWSNEASATFGLTADEPSEIQCRLDVHLRPGAEWNPCADGHTITGPLQEGRHVLEARTAGDPEASADIWIWRVDLGAPTIPTIHEPTRPWRRDRHVSASWGASDSYSGVGRFDVRYDTWSADGTARKNVSWLRNTKTTGAAFPAGLGRTYCFEVAVHDRAGNPAPHASPRRCFARPLDDSSLARQGQWKRHRNVDGYFLDSFVETKKRGASLRREAVARRLLLVATRCARCGSISVRWRGRVVKRVRLYAAKTEQSALIPLARLPSRQHGTLRLEVTSSARLVRIDGLGVRAV